MKQNINMTETEKLIMEFKKAGKRRKAELKITREELGLDNKYFEAPDVYPDVYH